MRCRGWIWLAVVFAGCATAEEPPAGYQGAIELDERRLGFEVPGRLTQVVAIRGATVELGAGLAHLDDRLAQLSVQGRAAELKAAEAQFALLAAGSRPEDVSVALAQLRAARARVAQLSRNVEQDRILADRGAIGAAGMKDREDELARAREEVIALEQRAQVVRKGARLQELDVAQARVEGATALLAAEKERLDRHQLRAPINGVIVEVDADPGEVVAAGTPIVVIADVAHPFVDVFVPQADLPRVQLGQGAQVRVDGLEQALPGRVEDIARTTEFTPRFLFSPRERPHLVIRVRIRIDDPAARLRAGMPAFVALAAGSS